MWNQHAVQVGDVMWVKAGESYRVLRFIAEGGYSEVYEVVREETGAHLAMKILRVEKMDSPKTLERHRREGETLCELRHRNVVAVHAVGVREDGLIFLIMDLLVGRTLRELQQDLGGRIPIPWVLEIMSGVCEGLDAVHEIAAIHRDLKPDNIHVGEDGIARLIDMGASKFPKKKRLTTGGTTIGTIEYMSPEQLHHPDTIDGRSDQFAFGVILYGLLSGVHPFAVECILDRDTWALGHRIIFDAHRPLLEAAPHVPDYLAAIVERCMNKDREERYRSAGVLWELLSGALERLLAELGENAPPPFSKAIGSVPRAEPAGERARVLSGPPSRNPFLTVSLSKKQPGPHGTAPLRVAAPPASDPVTMGSAPVALTLRSATSADHEAVMVTRTEKMPAFGSVAAPVAAPAPVAAAAAAAVPAPARIAAPAPAAAPPRVAALAPARVAAAAEPPSSITAVEVAIAPAPPRVERSMEAEEERRLARLLAPPRKSPPAKPPRVDAGRGSAAFAVVAVTALLVAFAGFFALRASGLLRRPPASTREPVLAAPASSAVPPSVPPSATVTAAPPPPLSAPASSAVPPSVPPSATVPAAPPPQVQASASARSAPQAPPHAPPPPPRPKPLFPSRLPTEDF